MKPKSKQHPQPTLSGYAIGEQLHLSLKAAHGEDHTYAQVADQIGAVRSSFHRWCRDVGVEHLRIMASLMELLNPEERTTFWNVVCRERPSLHHPRLAHDPNGIAQLYALFKKPKGLTLITGPGSATTFVLTALGIEFRRQDRSHRSLAGISVHPPHSIVPVPGVHYLHPLASRQELRRMLRECWPLLAKSSAPVVLLDAVPGVGAEALSLSRKKHVILALSQLPDWLSPRRFPAGSAHQVCATTATRPSSPIHVQVNLIP